MPRVCTICQHSSRADIDQALAAGTSYRNIAKQYNVSPQAMFRHKDEHVPVTLAKAEAAKEVARADTLLEQVQVGRERLEQMLLLSEHISARAYQSHDHRLVLDALRTTATLHREMRGYFDLMGELEGELQRNPQVNVTITLPWVQVIMHALEPFPAARAAAAAALMELDDATP